MDAALKRLSETQRTIESRNEDRRHDESCEKVLFCPVGDLLHVEFYGLPFDEAFEEFIAALCSPEVADSIGALIFRGPDEGANGTKNWDFSRLLESDAMFPALLSLFVEPEQPEHHNHSIIARDYDEEGQIGHLLKKAPRLQSLTVPSAPDATFFELGSHPLPYLRVDAGYDIQNFILNFSQSRCFPELRALDFGDFNQRYMKDYSSNCTPFEH